MDPWDSQPSGGHPPRKQEGPDSMFGWDTDLPVIDSFRDVGEPLYADGTDVDRFKTQPTPRTTKAPSVAAKGAGAVLNGIRFLARVAVSALWVALGYFAIVERQYAAAGIVGVYLVYLWLFKGRWLLF